MENENLQPQEAVRPVRRKPSPAQALYKDLRELAYTLVIVLTVLVCCFRMVLVSGDSMYASLWDGDRVLILSSFLYHDPQQGDVVVISKDSFRGGEPIIKRVIATEGQTVDIDFTTGKVMVDGVVLDEGYISSPTLTQGQFSGPLTVAKGCVFVMGDNRMDSVDSRYLSIGQIDKREILGKAFFLVIPGDDHGNTDPDYDRIGVIG